MTPVRRYVSIFFLSIYMIFSMGFVVNSHYCGGKLVDIGFFKEAKDCCCCSAENTKSDCCENEREVIFLDKEQTQAQQSTVTLIEFTTLLDFNISSDFSILDTEQKLMGITEEIPPPSIPKNILYQVFTLYA